jgi:MFS family permease
MGLDYDLQLVMSGILNVTQLVGVATSIWTMDRFGRRPLLLIGSALMTVSHIIIAVLVGLFDKNWPAHRAQGWTSVAFLFFYMLSFGASWGPVPWSLPSGEQSLWRFRIALCMILIDCDSPEIFPSSLRAKGVALSTCSNWLNNFIIVSKFTGTDS